MRLAVDVSTPSPFYYASEYQVEQLGGANADLRLAADVTNLMACVGEILSTSARMLFLLSSGSYKHKKMINGMKLERN